MTKLLNIQRENMVEQFPIELISNFASILILIALGYKYFQYKKNLDVIKGLDHLKQAHEITPKDLEFIKSNEREYREKVARAEANIKLSQPVFILIAGILIIMFDFQQALIHLNVVVVAFIFMQVDRIHKRNLCAFLKELKEATKQHEEQ